MKNIYLHCPLLPAEEYRKLLEFFCDEQTQNISIYTDFPNRVRVKDVERLVQVQMDFAQGRHLRFKNRGIFHNQPRWSKRLLRTLQKHSFTVELAVTEDMVSDLVKPVRKLTQKGLAPRLCVTELLHQPQIYETFARRGLGVCFQQPVYDADTADWFDRWLFDPKAQGINTFSDILAMLTLQTRSPNCRHASCFGTTFFVDTAMDVYLCPFHPDARTKLGNWKQADSLQAIFREETVAGILDSVVKKRSYCTQNCTCFPICQGGCMLNPGKQCDGSYYVATVARIQQRLQEVFREGKLDRVNYVVKNAILNALAFGTAFFNITDD